MAIETIQIPITGILYNNSSNINKAYDGNLSTYWQSEKGGFGNPLNTGKERLDNKIEYMNTFSLSKQEINKIPINSIITKITYKIAFSRRTSTSGGVMVNIWCGLGYSSDGTGTYANQYNLTGFQKFAENGGYQSAVAYYTQDQTKIKENYDDQLNTKDISQISNAFLTSQYPILCYTNSQTFRIYDIQVFLTYEPAPSSNLYIGNKQASALYVGNTKASAVYIGNTKVL